MPFGFHGPDLIIVLVLALLIFGPKKLPEMGASIGKSIREFKKGMNELTSPKEERAAAYEPATAAPIIVDYTATESAIPNYVANESIVESYVVDEPVVENYIVDEPVVESYEHPTTFDGTPEMTEVKAEAETHAQ